MRDLESKFMSGDYDPLINDPPCQQNLLQRNGQEKSIAAANLEGVIRGQEREMRRHKGNLLVHKQRKHLQVL